MVSLGRWAPDRGSPRDGSSAGHTRHQRAEGHQPHCTKHAGIQTGFCKIHHSPSTGSLSNQPMSPGIQLSSFGETQKPIKIKMLRFFKKKKNSVQQSTMFNLFKKKKLWSTGSTEPRWRNSHLQASEPFSSNYSKRGCARVLLAGFSHPIWKQLLKTFLQPTICQWNTVLLRHRLESRKRSLEKKKKIWKRNSEWMWMGTRKTEFQS